MALEWKDPPARKVVFNEEVLEELRACPGRWALLRTYQGHQCHEPKRPKDIEIRFHYVYDEGGKKVTEMYGRCPA